MSSNNRGWTAAKLGTQIQEQTGEQLEDDLSPWWTPYISDREVLRTMLVLKDSFQRDEILSHMDEFAEEDLSLEDAPREFEETELFARLFRTETGMSVSEALDQGDLHRQSAMVGLDQSDSSEGIGALVDSISAGWICYLFGSMGSGKTHFAFRVAELALLIKSEIRVGTNVMSLEDDLGQLEIDHMERRDTLEEWISEESDQLSLFIYDEASSTGSGYSSDAHKIMSNFRSMLQSFRKNNAALITIGHTGKDVHPHIVRQCNSIIEKPDKQTAEVYSEISDAAEPQEHQFSIDEIGDLDRLEFDTNEMSNWYWES